MNPKTVLNKVKELLSIEVKLETMELTDGTILEADAFEVGASIFILTGENRVALPVGEYTLMDGRVVIVTEEGVIAEVKDADAPAEEETPTEAPAEEAPELADEAAPKKIVESISKELFFEEIKKLNDRLDSITPKVEEPKEEVKEELSTDEPKKEAVKHSPEAKVEKKSNFHQPKQKLSQKDRIYKKLFS